MSASPDMLTAEGLATAWSRIAETFEPQVEGKHLSQNDFTDEMKTALESMKDTIETDVSGAFIAKGTLTAQVDYVDNDPDKEVESIWIPKPEGFEEKIGYVYNVEVPGSLNFSTAAHEGGLVFIDSEADNIYPSGSNIVYTADGWDVLAGSYDFSPILKKSELKDITEEDITNICKFPPLSVTVTRTTLEGAVNTFTNLDISNENPTSTESYSVSVSATSDIENINKIEASYYIATDTPMTEDELKVSAAWVAFNKEVKGITNEITYIKIIDKNGDDSYFSTNIINIITYTPFVFSKTNYQQTGLESLTDVVSIPARFSDNGTNYKVTGIADETFLNNAAVTKVVIPNTVTSIGARAFSGCKLTTTLEVPDSVETIGEDAFSGITVKYSGSATGKPWGATSITK